MPRRAAGGGLARAGAAGGRRRPCVGSLQTAQWDSAGLKGEESARKERERSVSGEAKLDEASGNDRLSGEEPGRSSRESNSTDLKLPKHPGHRGLLRQGAAGGRAQLKRGSTGRGSSLVLARDESRRAPARSMHPKALLRGSRTISVPSAVHRAALPLQSSLLPRPAGRPATFLFRRPPAPCRVNRRHQGPTPRPHMASSRSVARGRRVNARIAAARARRQPGGMRCEPLPTNRRLRSGRRPPTAEPNRCRRRHTTARSLDPIARVVARTGPRRALGVARSAARS
uniref:Uncharacterized protein n=1 Tax=Setaria viridis TaxID=4556 RepID=A0A4U6SU01_SETVI|nr:hypothetical protein SEVIR_9G122500v2 [Setaria viridis]